MIRVVAGVLALAVVASGCGSTRADDRVVVSAASSLVDRLTEDRQALAATNPDVDVELNFGGSTTLVTQVNEGAPVDILAVADRAAADAVEIEVYDEAIVGAATLHLIRHPEAADVESAAALADRDAVVAACDVSLPCGRLTDRVVADLGIAGELDIDTREPNVRAVLGRVEQGEADYGFVYDTELEVLADAVPTELRLPDSLTNDRILLLLSDDDASRTTFAELVRLADERDSVR